MQKWLVVILIALVPAQAMSQQEHLQSLPGYIDFGDLTGVYGEPRVMVNIGSTLLNLIEVAARKNEPELSQILSGLEGVRVNVYPVAGNPDPAFEQMNQVKDLLQRQNWEPIVQVREDNQTVHMFMKADSEGVQGLVVMAVDQDEAVFINILGLIDPESLGAVMNRLNVDVDVDGAGSSDSESG